MHSQWSRYRRIDVTERPLAIDVFTDGLLFHKHQLNEKGVVRERRAMPALVAAGADPPVEDVLILGAGTGSDVRIFRRLVPSNPRIVAVELDGAFVETAQAFPWLWDAYKTAEIVVQEGRFFLENDPRDFDMVVYAYIDPQSAISNIGLPDANFMYTDAGLARAYEKVRPGGHLVITRVFLVKEQEEFLRRLCATLLAAGIKKDEVQLYRSISSNTWSYYGELATVQAVIKKGGTPPAVDESAVRPLPWHGGGRPTTDFFPLSMVTGVWFDTLGAFVTHSIPALIVCGVLAAALVARLSTSAAHLNVFVLGFGSFLLESLVLFNSFILLGDPNLSAALAVGVFLLWSALGSLLSRRVERSRALLFAVPIGVLIYATTAPLLNGNTIELGLWVRTIAFSIHLALGGVAAGAMFPAVLRRFQKEGVSGLFALDLAGCALAPVAFWLALGSSGIWLVAIVSVASYAFVCGTLALKR